MNRDQLLELLDDFSIPVYQRDTSNGGTIVFTQRGARVLGLFPRKEGTSGNALWVNPNIAALLSGAAKDWEGNGEGSVGGDRLWVSPERDFYYKDPEHFYDWFTPAEMDPGNYQQIESNEGGVAYENHFDLTDHRQKIAYKNVVVRRKLAALEHPLLSIQTLRADWGTIGYAGVESEETIEIPAQEAPAPIMCPWGLTQVLAPGDGRSGTVVIPTARRASPIGYFGEIPADRVRVQDSHVSFRIDSEEIWKLAIAAEDLAPAGPLRIGYLMPVLPGLGGAPRLRAGEWLLLVRESSDIARTSADAVDPARDNPDGPRGVIQSYNNGPHGTPEYARVGEIEVQYLPLRQMPNGSWRSIVKSRLLAFQGDKEEILNIAQSLLALTTPPDLFE